MPDVGAGGVDDDNETDDEARAGLDKTVQKTLRITMLDQEGAWDGTLCRTRVCVVRTQRHT